MSRIGKSPITIPAGVTVKLSDDNVLSVKGPKGELEEKINENITVKVEGNEIIFERANDEKSNRSMHGLYRALAQNMVTGVSEGFKIVQEFVGVGYKVEVKGQMLDLSLGFSHSVQFQLCPEVKAEAITERGKNPVLILTSHDKQLLGQVAAKIRSMRKPEPYKGKGIKFQNEVLRRKAGKAAAAK
jgi:large subunit ribosomal protein L6